jgi:hypothetical protein
MANIRQLWPNALQLRDEVLIQTFLFQPCCITIVSKAWCVHKARQVITENRDNIFLFILWMSLSCHSTEHQIVNMFVWYSHVVTAALMF